MPKHAAEDPVAQYLSEIQHNLSSGIAREQTYRPALKDLIEALDSSIDAFNDPKHIEVGAPDFTIRRKGHATGFPVGWIETKDVGDDLDKTEKSEQLQRYFGLHNLILTDYLEFRWYVDGKLRLDARLASVSGGKRLRREPKGDPGLLALLHEFLAYSLATLYTPKDLAQRMAKLAHIIRDLLLRALETEPVSGRLHNQFEAFRETLIPDLKPDQFSDMYAQTIAYGLFAARCQTLASSRDFSRAAAADLIPRTNPFLRRLFREIAFELDPRVQPFVDDLVALLRHAEIRRVMEDFGKRTAREDPVVHFYEDFLQEYDSKVREMRGVYYTPEPIVSYIVRSVDHLLKTKFDKPLGLADKDVLILDPACGTGTFLYYVIRHIYDAIVAGGQRGQWNSYVSENLLKRVFGFELLMAPYAVAHLKLGLLLQELGYKFESEERLGIYLTNTLEEAVKKAQQVLAFADYISAEGEAANSIKREKKIMVVLGNPPYSGHSANRSWEMIPDPKTKKPKKVLTFIGRLMQDYYQVDGRPLGEKNPKWLQDDYVKFIRFGQWRIDLTGYGILAFITNHGYLDNPTFRGMRQQLMHTFSEIGILDLHGNAKKKETAPDGSKDENVFDIQQGVAIGICLKEPNTTNVPQVQRADLWGEREAKYRTLFEIDIRTTKWERLFPQPPAYLYVPQSTELLNEYEQGWKVSDMFPVNSVGIVSARDGLAVGWTREELWKVVQDFANISADEAREKYDLGPDAQDWKVKDAQQDVLKSGPKRNLLVPILYRPFDTRFTYYTGESRGFICRPRAEVMPHMLQARNVGLLWTRPMSPTYRFSVLATRSPIDQCAVGNKTAGAGISYLAPLYLSTPTETQKPSQGRLLPDELESAHEHGKDGKPNLDRHILSQMERRLELKFVPHRSDNLKESFGPESLLNYCYAVFHSPTYSKRYAEFLSKDVPRLPLTSDRRLFTALAAKGEELISLHLMESHKLDSYVTQYEKLGDHIVERVTYIEPNSKAGIKSGRVYINSGQFFEGVPKEVWEFQIGGYQVCEKWLKDRKGRKLSSDDIDHFQRITVAVFETIRIMHEIDDLIPGWPLP
ncbi:MAG TPA: type ISP restriction/modification enzyme [Candidatus Acidoferrum sp.]|nr:type ISP restriction/modification enzyme [Candidatus Acidoferrum sp.]